VLTLVMTPDEDYNKVRFDGCKHAAAFFSLDGECRS
jgi:hypothetical protein